MDDLDLVESISADTPSDLVSTPTWNGASGAPQLTRATTFSGKIQTILASSYTDVGIRDSLETLDSRKFENNQNARRNLRLDIQREIIDCNADIVNDFGQVAEQLRIVGKALEKLQRTCADMRSHISTARLETTLLADEADGLFRQKEQIENKQALLSAVRNHFILSEEELVILTSSAQPVTNQFFQVLVKCKKIRKDCQVLLGTENQRLGLDILEQSTKHLNAAYPKLYRWIQREFKSLNLENPQISTSIRRALRVLAERPTLFQNCIDSFGEAREHSLSDAFYSALTGSGDESGRELPTKPLEFTAHEPLRYIGDMLAWAHSTTVSEREALEVLFISEGDEIAKSIKEGLEDEPWSREENVEVFDGRKALNQLVNRDLTGIARQLRQRIEQVIQSHDEAVLAYKISNLIGFYRNIFLRFLDADSSFVETLSWLESSAVNQFRKTMEFHLKAVQNEKPTPGTDLAPPEFLSESLDELKSLLKSYDTSFSSTAQSTSDSNLRLVLAEALDPYLEMCDTMSDTLPEPAGSIFTINCLALAKLPLTEYAFADSQAAAIEARIAAQSAALTDSQHAFFVSASGLGPLLAALSTNVASEELPKLAAFAPEPLTAASEQLDAFLPSAMMDAAEQIKRLQNSALINTITNNAAARFCDDFAAVEEALTLADEAMQVNGEISAEDDETEEPVRLLALFPRTSEEISILLS